MRGIVWFREDLRVGDNTALFNAAQHCESIIGVYIIDTSFWLKHDMAACRVDFILRGLQQLKMDLHKLNIPLITRVINNTAATSDALLKIAHQFHAESLYFNIQYEINESRRDQSVQDTLVTQDISCYRYHDQVILPPGSVKNLQGDYYKVFTAFKRAWYQKYCEQNGVKLMKAPKQQAILDIPSSAIPTEIAGFASVIDPTLWPAGEKAALRQLKHFIETNLFDYDKQRDFPDIEGTSKISPYLSTGMISPRSCFLAALTANHNEFDSGNKGASTWMSELVWREFYKHILAVTPRISMNQPYKLETKKLHWFYDKKKLIAWQQGKSGIPIIDAAMRQLNTTGWMHNRLRMITAMYFTKNLFFDWRLGEKYFIQQLIDGDLAANNGGWQWCAGTGTDAAPYFRIFNPVTQSERFDPEGKFIRQYCPELTDFDNHSIHDPHARNPLLANSVNYPTPLVDLKSSRVHAIEAFKAIMRS